MTWGTSIWGIGVWGLGSPVPAPAGASALGRLNIWRMLFDGIRQLDGHEMGLLKKICDALDLAWEDFLYDPVTALPTLFEVESIDKKWLPYLKPLLGFTREIPFDATEEELRRVLVRAVPFWNDKPSELGSITHAIRMVSGSRFRVRNYFDHRMVVGETCLGEEMEDFDPMVVDFPSKIATGLRVIIGPGAVGPGWFEIDGGNLLFETVGQYRYLYLEEPETLKGCYPIESLMVGTGVGKLFGAPFPNDLTVDGALYGTMDEYLSEVRLVDRRAGYMDCDRLTASFQAGERVRGDYSGAVASVMEVTDDNGAVATLKLARAIGRFVDGELLVGNRGGSGAVKGKLRGLLNRTLLRFMLEVNRVVGERYDLVYTSFLDQFETPNDLDQWTHQGGVTVPSPGCVAIVPAGASMLVNDATAPLVDADADLEYDSGWDNYRTAWKVTGNADTILDLVFRQMDATNRYLIRVSFPGELVSLIKVVAGAETVITSVAFPFHPAVYYGVRAEVFTDDSGEAQIRVLVDGEPVFSPDWQGAGLPSHAGGIVGQSCSAGEAKIKLVEVCCWPPEIDHVGPPPWHDPSYAYSGGWHYPSGS